MIRFYAAAPVKKRANSVSAKIQERGLGLRVIPRIASDLFIYKIKIDQIDQKSE